MTEIEKLYLNYLDCGEGQKLSFEEYQEERKKWQGIFAEVDAEKILKDAAERLER